jgi:aspartokinase/homoserine dehydrogenase 1
VALVVSALGPSTEWLVQSLDAAATGDAERSRRASDAFARLALAHTLPEPVRQEVSRKLHRLREQLRGILLLGEASPRVRDRILAVGEAVSSLVVASRLVDSGIPAVAVDAREWLVTDDRHGEARVDVAASSIRLDALRQGWADAVPVVTGFFGRSRSGSTTTLGRNGSDYTATLLAAGLKAAEVQIWSDVDGVMTADPELVDEAQLLEALSYDEALELATFGARVLHPRTMIPLREHGIPLRIRNTLGPGHQGTRVDPVGGADETRATSVTSLSDQALVDIQLQALDRGPKVAERLHRALEGATDTVWLATHSAHGQAMSVVVPLAQVGAVQAAIEEALALEIERGELKPLRIHAPVALLTLVAEAMGQTPNVAGRLFGALGRIGINVRAIGQSASARSISCVVDESSLPLAVRTVHAAFHLTHHRASVLVLGKGTVGGALLRQLDAQRAVLRAGHDVEPVIVGVADRHRVAYDPGGLDLSQWPDLLEQASPVAGPCGPVGEALLDELATLPVPILVDCTASASLATLYEAAWSRGIHVVSANKKPLTLPGPDIRRLRQAARLAHREWRYETTVGAALPIIETIQKLVRTGDRVTRIEGSLSGTLGYLCVALSDGVSIAEAVRNAMEKGFTEPRPQEDLAGTDAARKAIILARELGLELDLEDVIVEPLVPAALLAIEDVDEFLAALKAHGPALTAHIDALRQGGEVLRYLATIDPDGSPALRVGPVAVGPGHPAYPLKGPTALVAITSRRYPDEPLVVQGAGAGGDVTAAGVLADILQVALRQR